MKINIGGFKHNQSFKGKDWTIVDNHPKFNGNRIDLNKDNLPFSSNSIEGIYTSNTLEHILPHRQQIIFSEMYRVLKPEGLIRIVVPDITIAVNMYINKQTLNVQGAPSKQPSLPNLEICFLASWFFTYREQGNILGGHVMCYNKELLYYYLNNAKFENIETKKYNDCSLLFNDCDLETYKDFALYVEAQKGIKNDKCD